MNKKAFKIVFLDSSTVDLGDIRFNRLASQGVLKFFTDSKPSQIHKRAKEAEIIITNKIPFDAKLLSSLKKLKLICAAATGVNNVDLEEAKKRGIAVCNVAGYSTSTVAEHTLLFILAMGHRLLMHHRGALGAWSRSSHFAVLDFPFSELKGKMLGILGYGRIGREVARLARAFGMNVSVAKLPGRTYSAKSKRLPFNQALKKSDFVTIHTQLTPLTRHLMDGQKLKLMKRGSVLINMARGDLVSESAVVAALRSGKLSGYGADVLSKEPPDHTHPFFRKDVRDKILLTPHVAWASRESRQKLVDEIAKNIEAFKMGKKRNRVV